jgi:hypothetical protein
MNAPRERGIFVECARQGALNWEVKVLHWPGKGNS